MNKLQIAELIDDLLDIAGDGSITPGYRLEASELLIKLAHMFDKPVRLSVGDAGELVSDSITRTLQERASSQS